MIKESFIGAVCFKENQKEKELSLEEILLDETLIDGELWADQQALCEAGGINSRLESKRHYELLLRIAQTKRILLTDKEKKAKYLKEFSKIGSWKKIEADERYQIGKGWIEECQTERCQIKRYQTERYQEERQKEMDWKTDCYVISRYKDRLLAMGCFDDAVMGVISMSGGKAEHYLEQMLLRSEEYYKIYDNTQPVLIYMGEDLCYYILDTFAKNMGEALGSLGCNVIYFNTAKQKVEDLSVYIGKRLKAVIGMQTYMFSAKRRDGKFVHDLIGAPEYFFVFDHPVWLRHHLMHVPEQLTVLTPDRNYAAFIEKYYGHKALFFPPAGQDRYYGSDNRQFEISFLGTYRDSLLEELKDLRRNDKNKAHIVSRYILYMRQNITGTPEDAMKRLLEYYDINCTPEAFEEQFFSLRWTMLRLAHYYRRKVVETLLKAGFTLHVFGSSWQDSPLRNYPGLVCHAQAVGEEALKVYGNSKLSLNVMTWHKDGFTERIANAMLQKSVVVTDRTFYLEQNFIDGKELIIFDLKKMQKLPGRIRNILEHENQRVKMAECGFEKAKKEHTWQKRAEELLLLMDKQEDACVR